MIAAAARHQRRARWRQPPFWEASAQQFPRGAAGASACRPRLTTPAPPPAPAALELYDYVFSENGLVAHKAGKELAVQSLKTHLGDDKLKK